ncbi:MAG TPA: hypothetical protein VK796_12395, partial [Cytophaga sp.]|nr:hypothetical protein [Cytophaga sp.]
QVFITDEVKDIVPEFLMLLHGVIDSPDIPLNVSRSFLQADGNVKKINSHITKKVADKLNELFNNDRPGFEAKWDDIGMFVKYGMISEEKFYDKAKNFCLLKNTDNALSTIEEYEQKIKPVQTDKNNKLVYLYSNNAVAQDIFIQAAKKKQYDVLLFDSVIDSHFLGQLENKLENVQFKRIDSESVDKLIEKDEPKLSLLTKEQETQAEELFKKVINNGKVIIKLEHLAVDDMPVTIVISEFMRRMKDMAATSGQSMFGGFELTHEVVVNTNHPLIAKAIVSPEADGEQLIKQTYQLGLLSQGLLQGAELSAFIERNINALVK